MDTVDVWSRDDLVRAATDAGSTLRRHARWCEDNRRLHDDVIDALADAGVFRLRTPRRYGGIEADTATLVDVAAELGRAYGSAAWVSSVYWIPTWMACQFPRSVQDEVFATENVRISGTLSPSAMSAPVDGGIVVNGKWGWISGAHHAHWQEIIAIHAVPGETPYPVVALVPMSDLLIVDDWHTDAMRGSGSVSTVAQDLFVPQERVVPLPAILEGGTPGADGIYGAPLLPVASASSVGVAVGLARAARDVFHLRVRDRKITYTNYDAQSEAPITHLKVAEAATAAAEAEFHATSLAARVDEKCADGEAFKLDDRVAARASLGATVRRAQQAVDVLASAGGGSSVYRDVALGRIARDVGAIALHALMNPDTNAELQGRVLCGLEPNSQYV